MRNRDNLLKSASPFSLLSNTLGLSIIICLRGLSLTKAVLNSSLFGIATIILFGGISSLADTPIYPAFPKATGYSIP